ncbi:cyclopropane mycolic acid synthase 3 [Mycobacterium kansasii 662]|uniref:Cyclopropane mycolic acid synthase 3 n=1 Tax=Mycobacterium kansasii 662 TaxID=1299326 RepID=X7XVT0_MYCKA|nr:cyclopropane mycolic acid synthase 3 [Mycobacterium kansasii 662]
MSVQLTPHFGNVQAHYDLSDDFFRLFLDPTQTYSCAYFERDDMTLEEAQLQRSTCRWKAQARAGDDVVWTSAAAGRDHAASHRKVRRQCRRPDIVREPGDPRPADVRQTGHPRTRRVLLEGWEKFHEPVDRIVSIGAFEHFGRQRYPRFFKMAYNVLPSDGVMLLHHHRSSHLQRRSSAGG